MAARKPTQPVVLRRRALEKIAARRMGPIDSIWYALRADNILGTMLGSAIGGGFPTLSYVEAHHDLDNPLRWALVIGGLLFSCLTFYQWGIAAGWGRAKAVGAVLLTEGVMVTSRMPAVALSALAVLVLVNGASTGVGLALGKHRIRPKRK